MRRTSLEARCSSDRVRLERSETQFSSLSSSAAVRIFVMMMIISITHMILSTHLQITGDTPHYTTITGRRVKMSVNFYINSILNGLIPYMPLCRYLSIQASVNFLCQSGFSRFLGFQTEDIFTTITTAFIVIDLDPGESLSVPIR